MIYLAIISNFSAREYQTPYLDTSRDVSPIFHILTWTSDSLVSSCIKQGAPHFHFSDGGYRHIVPDNMLVTLEPFYRQDLTTPL